MKTSRFILAGLFAFGVASPVRAAEEHSMIGCLARAADGKSFVLTNVEGAVPTVAIAEATPDLAPHVGHKVSLTGVTVAGADAKVHTMNITAMKHLAATCP